MRSTLVIVSMLVLFSCTKTDTPAKNDDNDNPPGDTNPPLTNSNSTNEAQLLTLVNNVRKSGCTCGTTVMPAVPEVTWNDLLEKAALDHSIDMNKNNYFSHTGLDGSDPGKRITAAGYKWRAYGENIAKGYTSEQAVMDGWLKSEGHCKNIMSKNVKEMGVGRDGNLWTQVFAAQ